MVSHSYVVISTAHPYIADIVIFCDGTKNFVKAERDAKLFDTDLQDTQFLSKLYRKTPSFRWGI